MPNFDASFKIGLDEAIALLENLEAFPAPIPGC